MVNLGPKFYHKLLEVSQSTGIAPEHLLNIMASESGLNPAAGSGNTAAGLVQIMPQYLKSLGYNGTADEFRKEPPENQLIYIEKLIKSNLKLNKNKPYRSAAQYYVSNFLPACLKLPGIQKEDPNTILASKNPTEAHIPGSNIGFEKKVYEQNAGLDYDKDGNISYGDLINHLNRKTKQKPYLSAINELKKHTGHEAQPGNEALPDQKNIIQDKIKPSEKAMASTNLDSVLDKLLHMIRASEKDCKKLYKNFLPKNNFVIKIKTNDKVDAIEFGRILCLALEEELLAKSSVCTNDNLIEIQGSIRGPKQLCMDTIKQLTDSLIDAFKQATIKIGGININTDLIINKKSYYSEITLESSLTNYRRFMLKFA